MKLYTVSCTEYYEDYDIEEMEDLFFEEYDGISKLVDKWGTKELEKTSKGKKADIAYCWSFSSIVMPQETYELIKDIFSEDEVELLPVSYKEKKYYIPHIIKSYKIPVLTDERKDAPFYYVYKEEDIVNAGLNEKFFFKLEYEYGVMSETYYTERFITLIKELDLKGVEFEVEWDSES